MRSAPPLGDELTALLGSPKRVRSLASSPRSEVWRARLDGTPAVIKQLVAGPGAEERYAHEVAAIQAASVVQPAVVPRLLGTDPAERVLVTESIEEQKPAADWVIGYASALGRLHSTPTEGVDLPTWSGPTSADIEAFLKLAAWLGIPVSDEVGTELEAMLTRLAARSARGDLLHGDPCPANDLHTADGVRFVDFEQAALGDGTVELAYLRIAFPTCWCATAQPPELIAEAEAAYAAATGRVIDEHELADACAGWTIRGDALVQRAHRETADHLARLTVEDWKLWTVSARDRLAYRLGVVGRLGDGPLRETALLAERMREAMLQRWPGLRPLPTKRP
ncbi:tRNA A-37 threonylcarbamoyl transferase component Bud32 [Catenulispora sp. EB89]|uniref:phosphotransferase n=1 Tax=Catenulispora sp. EB89 TaxID=3156257 RepID=UPI00351775D5